MEAMLQEELRKRELGTISVESAGILKAAEGQTINEHSLHELADRGIPLEGHVSRYIGNIGDLSRFGMILCVGESEAAEVMALFPQTIGAVEVTNAETGGIANPWQRGPEAYRACAIEIEQAMCQIAQRIQDMR